MNSSFSALDITLTAGLVFISASFQNVLFYDFGLQQQSDFPSLSCLERYPRDWESIILNQLFPWYFLLS